MSETRLDPQVRLASFVSIVVAALIFVIKFQAYRMTGSQALFSEAMETVVNVLAAAITFAVIYYAAKPADRDHPYGHGKVEYLSAALEGGMIAFAAFLIILEAVQAFYEQKPLHSLDMGVGLLAATGVMNLTTGFYLKSIGKRRHSMALEAGGRHLIADFWTTAGVVVGLVLVIFTKIFWLDIAIAILVSLNLIKEGYEVLRKAIGGLLDEEQESLIKEIQEIINKHKQEGIIQVHHVRVMRAGRYHHIDAHVVVPEYWSVEVAHDNTLKYEQTIFKDYQFSGEMHLHIDPCRRLYCQFCDVKNCPIRQEDFKGYRKMGVHEITNPEEPQEITSKLRD